MRIKAEPKVGWWYSLCCELDLFQIEDEQELKECLEMDKENLEDDFPPHRYWPTKKEALKDILR